MKTVGEEGEEKRPQPLQLNNDNYRNPNNKHSSSAGNKRDAGGFLHIRQSQHSLLKVSVWNSVDKRNNGPKDSQYRSNYPPIHLVWPGHRPIEFLVPVQAFI